MKTRTNIVLLVLTILAYFSSLHSARAFYDPGTQRWLNRDPVEELGGTDLYTFALNAPTVLFDYLGLEGFRNPVLPPNFQYPIFGPLSIPTVMPPGNPTPPPVIPPVSPPNARPPGNPGDTTACGLAGAAEMAGNFFGSGLECRARSKALSMCDQKPHSLSGCSSCCVVTLSNPIVGPSGTYQTTGFGYVANKPCSKVADEGGLSPGGSKTEFNPW